MAGADGRDRGGRRRDQRRAAEGAVLASGLRRRRGRYRLHRAPSRRRCSPRPRRSTIARWPSRRWRGWMEWRARPAASSDPWDQTNGFRLLDEGHDEVRWKDGEREVGVIARRRRDGGFGLALPGGALARAVQRGDEAGWRSGWAATPSRRASCGGRWRRRRLRACSSTAAAAPCAWSIRSTSRCTRPCAADEGAVRSPLPGKIIDLRVKEGDNGERASRCSCSRR